MTYSAVVALNVSSVSVMQFDAIISLLTTKHVLLVQHRCLVQYAPTREHQPHGKGSGGSANKRSGGSANKGSGGSTNKGRGGSANKGRGVAVNVMTEQKKRP